MKTDRMRQNLVAGLVGSVWSAGLGIAVVPLYLKYLGLEAYGLIGIFATVQSLFSLLDLGLSPAMNREVARGAAEQNMRPARELLHTLSLVYWTTALAIALIAVLAAPFFAHHWLQSNRLGDATVRNALMLMGFVVACRWPVGLYLGTLIGAQRVTVSSGITIVMSAAGNLGAIAILGWLSPRIEVFFIWQAAIGILYAFAMRSAAWHAIGRESAIAFSVPALMRIWRFSAGISGIAVSALVLTQIDKVVMSRFLSLSDFGQYSLATVVVSGLYLFINPMFNVIYPRFTALVTSGDTIRLADLYRWGTRLFAMTLFPFFMLLAVFAEDLVRLWTGNGALAANVSTVIALLSTGAALHGVMYFSYALQLAHGITRLPLTINLVLVALAAPMMTLLAWRYGIKGGAAAVLVLYLSYLFIGTWMTHRLLLKSIGIAWLCRDVGAPFVVALTVGIAGRLFLTRAICSDLQKLGVAVAMLLGAWAFSIAIAPRSTLPRLMRIFNAPEMN